MCGSHVQFWRWAGSISEKATAPHSSTLAWKIPWMEEPGRLQAMGLLRAGHNWATSLSVFTFMHWRRKWHPTPILLPGESQGWGSLVGCRLWGRTESDTTEAGSHRVRHDWSDLAAAAGSIYYMQWIFILWYPEFTSGHCSPSMLLCDAQAKGLSEVISVSAVSLVLCKTSFWLLGNHFVFTIWALSV